MTFSELYTRVIEGLSESSTPEYWSMTELKRRINEGYREFIKDTECYSIKSMLVTAESGRYYVPSFLLKIKQVYYNQKILEQKSIEFLDSYQGGTSHFYGLRGDGKLFGSDWRVAEGIPDSWFFDEGKIGIYPIPKDDEASVQASEKLVQKGILLTGATSITLHTPLTTNQSQKEISFFLSGIRQTQFTVVGLKLIKLAFAVPADTPYEIVMSSGNTSVLKETGIVMTGATTIVLSASITTDQNNVDFVLGGVYQHQNQFTIGGSKLINLNFTIPANTPYEIWETSGSRIKETGIIASGTFQIPLSNSIDTGQNNVDFILGGVYQHQNQFATNGSNLINFAFVIPVNTPYEIWETSGSRVKETGIIASGASQIPLSNPITTNQSKTKCYLSGVQQSSIQFTLTSSNLITLSFPIPADTPYEIVSFPKDISKGIIKEAGILIAGATTINLLTPITTDKNKMSFFLAGVWQDQNKFSIVGPKLINLNFIVPVNTPYEIMAIAENSSISYFTRKIKITGTVGMQYLRIPYGYFMGENAISINFDGTNQSQTTWTEIDNYTIKLNVALSSPVSIVLAVLSPIKANQVECRFVCSPKYMIDDNESPENILEQYQDAIWFHACGMALSREGRGQDLEKASTYLSMYGKLVDDFKRSFSPSAIPYPEVPFMV